MDSLVSVLIQRIRLVARRCMRPRMHHNHCHLEQDPQHGKQAVGGDLPLGAVGVQVHQGEGEELLGYGGARASPTAQ